MTRKKLIIFILIELMVIAISAALTYWYFSPEPEELLLEPPPTLTPMISPSPSLTPEPTATASAKPKPQASYKTVMATMFWVGETADESNAQIPNDKSAWDANWQESFGGVDDPENRCGYSPCAFTPKENPFYFALPYNDLDQNGNRKPTASMIPWFEDYQNHKSVLKNRWVEIRREGQTCFAQWQDVGPLESDDFAYVFGNHQPKNQFGAKAGIDLSPAVFDCLQLETNAEVSWRFIDDSQVPDGPWKEIVTNSPVRW